MTIISTYKILRGPKCADCMCDVDSNDIEFCDDCKPINEIYKFVFGIFPFKLKFEKSKLKDWYVAKLPNEVELHLCYDYGTVLVLLNPNNEWDFVEASEKEILRAATGLWKG